MNQPAEVAVDEDHQKHIDEYKYQLEKDKKTLSAMWTQAITYFCSLTDNERFLRESLSQIASVREYEIVAPNVLLELIKNSSQSNRNFSIYKEYMNT